MPILHWNTRNADIRAAARAPYHTLSAVPRLAHGQTDSHNLLVKGDNLLALKALVPHYAESVNCVFIDPPYNTRKDFPHYQDNLEHSQWLEMMQPRLLLLHELLAPNGSIWVIIDDDEAHYLKVLMDEVFGRKNFVANVVWQKKFSPQNDEDFITAAHDHILVYAKKKSACDFYRLPRTEEHNRDYKNPDGDHRGPWGSGDMTSKTKAAGHSYPVKTPAGVVHYPPPGRKWGPALGTYERWLADNRIWFGKDGKNRPRIKQFLSEVGAKGIVPMSLWFRDDVDDNQAAKKEVMKFCRDDDIFETPKPERLIMRVLQLATQPGDLVLDSFLGSGTTAAVAHKTGRRWIGIEMGAHAETHCVPRLRAVADGADPGGVTKAAGWKGGGGFRFSELGPAVFTEDGEVNPEIKFPELAAHIWFSETRTPFRRKRRANPFLGAHRGAGYALLYNGILRDKRVSGGNILTRSALAECRNAASAGGLGSGGNLIIYGNGNRLSARTLRAAMAEFRQIPYEVKKR